MRSILIIEDDVGLSFGLRLNLQFDGFVVTVASTAEEAVQILQSSAPDLIILDIGLPDRSGLDLLRELRASGSGMPIIVLSGMVAETDRVAALRLGANDFIAKPFSLLELLERCKIQLRRAPTAGHQPPTISVVVDVPRRCLGVNGANVTLTRKEYELLLYLIRAQGNVRTKKEILREIWGFDRPVKTKTLECHIKQLRSKLRIHGLEPSVRIVARVGFAWAGPHPQLTE